MKPPLDEIESRLKKVLSERTSAGLDPAALHSDVGLVGKGLALDSVTLLELVVGIEQEFEIIFDDSELKVQHFESLHTLALHVQQQLESQRD